MAIAFDTNTDGPITAQASPATWTHTCTGSNLILFVTATMLTATDTVSGVTYNGVAMTKIAYKQSAGGDRGSSLWYLIAPATGANTVSVTGTGGGSNWSGNSASYTGAKQSGVPDSSASDSQNNANITVSTTVVGSNAWLVGGGTGNTANVAAGAGTTMRGTQIISGFIGDSNGTVGTGAQSLNFTETANWWSLIVASFLPAASSVSPVSNLPLLGVG